MRREKSCNGRRRAYNDSMMKPSLFLSLGALVLIAALPACTTTSGAVGSESFAEMMTAPRMAVTATNPGWLLDDNDIHPLTPKQVARVKEILCEGELREVSEKYYRDASEGNRGDSTDALFYLYASNAQCLGGRVLENRVLMDDFNLSAEAEKELFSLLRPQLAKLLPSVP